MELLLVIILLLIKLCCLALGVYLIVWVLSELGFPIPARAMRIIWVIVALIAMYIIVSALVPSMGRYRLL